MNDKGIICRFASNLVIVISIILLVNILLPFNSSSDVSIVELSDSMSVWTDDLDDLTGINSSADLRIEDGDVSLVDIRFDPQGWDKKGIAIPNGTGQDEDSIWTMQPYVLKEGNEYKMWYTGYNYSGVYHIMYATSSDGIDWIKHGPVFGPEYNLVNDLWLTAVPSILKDGNIYKMYYSGSDVADRLYFNMYMATSPDGITWTDHGMVLAKGENGTTEVLGVMNGKVIKTPDDFYKMIYTGYDGLTWRLHLATSVDGINWERKGMILDVGPIGSADKELLTEPFVIYHHDTYFLWYTGYPMIGKTVICFATSLDGENWTKHGQVMDSSLDTDFIRVGGAHVLIDDDGLVKLWYYGFDGFFYKIHYATKQQHSPNYLKEGELTSEVISIPDNKVWTSLNISKTDIDADNYITVSVLNAQTEEVIDGFLNLTGENIDLSAIAHLDHPSIQVEATFASDGTETPVKHSWELVMSEDTKDYFIIQSKAGELANFNYSNSFGYIDAVNCTWTFELNRLSIPQSLGWG